MNRPRQPGRYDDRFLECQASMEDHFNDIMEAAINAGWSPMEAVAAITDLADNYALKLFSLDATQREITRAIGRLTR
jgi:hypothetical protein